jgi:hypothetical protein
MTEPLISGCLLDRPDDGASAQGAGKYYSMSGPWGSLRSRTLRMHHIFYYSQRPTLPDHSQSLHPSVVHAFLGFNIVNTSKHSCHILTFPVTSLVPALNKNTNKTRSKHTPTPNLSTFASRSDRHLPRRPRRILWICTRVRFWLVHVHNL